MIKPLNIWARLKQNEKAFLGVQVGARTEIVRTGAKSAKCGSLRVYVHGLSLLPYRHLPPKLANSSPCALRYKLLSFELLSVAIEQPPPHVCMCLSFILSLPAPSQAFRTQDTGYDR